MTRWVSLVILFCLIGAAYIYGLGSFPLTERSEARYTGVAWEMMVSGDYLTPRYNGIKHFHKPPLFYWMIAGSMKLLGPTEIAARLPCALAALATIGLTAWLAARPSLGCPRPWLAGAVLATAPFFWEMGRIAVTDMLLTLLVLVALASAWQILHEGESALNLSLFWGSLGLGFLTKGPVGPLIVAMVLGPYLYRTGSGWRRLRPFPGLLAALLIALPWYLLVIHENAGLLGYFLKFQTVDRVFTTVHQRAGPPWFYGPVLLGGFLPWSVWLALDLPSAWRGARWPTDGRVNPDLFLLLWVALPVVFFSMIGSKLAPYVLPVFPGMAILTARHLSLKSLGRAALPASLMVVTALLALAQSHSSLLAKAAPFANELRWAGLWLLASGAAGWLAVKRRRDLAIGVSLVGMLGLLLIAAGAFGRLSYLSARPLASGILAHTQGPFEVAILERYLFGLPYYLGQRVVQVDQERETLFETDLAYRDFLYPDLEAYLPVFRRGDKDRFLIVSRYDYASCATRLSEPSVYADGNFLVFKHSALRRRSSRRAP